MIFELSDQHHRDGIAIYYIMEVHPEDIDRVSFRVAESYSKILGEKICELLNRHQSVDD